MPRFGLEPDSGGDGNVRPIQERNRLLIANPHIADWWVWERMQVFKKYFLVADMADATWDWDRAEWQSRSSLHVHGCSSWACEGDERMTALSRTYLEGHIARRRAEADGDTADVDGGVRDKEMARCAAKIAALLNGIGFTALNQDPPTQPGDPTVPTSEEARARGREELQKDMRDFPWDDVSLNACMRHTRCGAYCLKNGRCRFALPKARRERLTLKAHPLTTPPTDNVDDWQLVATPRNALPRAEGDEDDGEYDPFVNRHIVVQLLGWGANVDFSLIVDQGMPCRYMVKYTSKGEARSTDVRRKLTTLVRHAASLEGENDARLTLPSILRRAFNTATTRRDMGVQEVQHLNLQTCSVLNDVEYVRANTEDTSVEVQRGRGGGGLAPVRGLIQAYSVRLESAPWAADGGGRPPQDRGLEGMNYCTFAATYKLTRDKKIKRHDRKNGVASFLPFSNSRPTHPNYADYCRRQLVKFRAWHGGMHNGWDGQE
ncbi:unnamed protein product, partial [Pylaiella littoralis]